MVVRRAAAWVGLVIGCAAPPEGAPPTTSVRAATFNVRYDLGLPSTDPHAWSHPDTPRRDAALAVIEALDVDVLGTQEALLPQVLALDEGLPDHERYGVGRDDGATAGEHCAIWWRRDRFERLDAGTFWLSPTPDVPGSRHPDAAVVRIASWVRLLHDELGELLVVDTHWDHQSAPARRDAAAQVVTWLDDRAPSGPVLVLGDLNATEDDDEVRALGDAGLVDAYRAVRRRRSEEATFHAWTGRTLGERIDFVLVDGLTPVEAEIDRSAPGGQWPSDHYAVVADLRWP